MNQFLLAGLIAWLGTFGLVVLDKFAEAAKTRAETDKLRAFGEAREGVRNDK